MSGSVRHAAAVIPAKLSYLAIYNPSLGTTDKTLRDQIVFHSSKATRARRRHKTKDGEANGDMHEEENERLRQIGLAQGMVEFARGFSDGKAVDSVETEKSRIILHEIEAGWWMLASIDLTRITSSPDIKPSISHSDKPTTSTEYSSREVCPSVLLLQHIIRAHSIFLLHHGPSLNDLYIRLTRARFCGALDRFWNRFIRNWDVLLHGNPAVDVFDGLKLAAGGELGIGVGEEEWGSGEREVLEGFIDRTEGLVELVVSRFGEAPQEPDSGSIASHPPGVKQSIKGQDIEPWLGDQNIPAPQDGVIFSGAGSIARKSLKSISSWMEWLYKYGDDTYGIRDNPSSAPRRKRKTQGTQHTKQSSGFDSLEFGRASESHRGVTGGDVYPSGIPPPIVTATESSLAKATAAAEPSTTTKSKTGALEESAFGTENVMKYLTLGLYGSSWGFSAKKSPLSRRITGLHEDNDKADKAHNGIPENPQVLDDGPPLRDVDPEPESDVAEVDLIAQKLEKSIGRFVIGLRGDLENETATDDEIEMTDPGADRDIRPDNSNSRIMLRTLHVERVKVRSATATSQSDDSNVDQERSSPNCYDKLRVVIYVHQPFVFTFLFELHTESLTMSSFYRSLHHQLGPLQRPLLSSTSPANVSQRLWDASATRSTTPSTNAQPIYDLVYDPSNLSIHTSIPNIPEPGTAAAEGLGSTNASWTRIEALNVHSQILNTYIDTRRHASELERTCKTNRGWWVVWMRLPHSPPPNQSTEDISREALLIRKASDYVAPAGRSISSRFGRDASGSSAASGWGAGKLAEGIGIDTRRYIEGLLSLNR